MLELLFRSRERLTRFHALLLVAQDELLAEVGQDALLGFEAFEGLVAPDKAELLFAERCWYP